MANSYISRSYRDRNGEASGFRVQVTELTAANFTALTGTDIPALITAIDALTLGLAVKNDFIQDSADLAAPGQKASDQDAHRELKWRIVGYDSVTYDPWSMEIPCAKIDGVAVSGQDFVDLEGTPAAPWAAFKTAVEADVLSKNGNAVTLLKAILVGRNL